MHSRDQRLVQGLAALAWLALVVSLYYVGHKPFTPAQAAAAGRALGQSAAAGLLASAGGGLGVRLLPAPRLRPLAALALQAALGLGLLSLGALLTGAVIGIHPGLAWGSLLALAGLLRHQVVYWWRSWGDLGSLWRESDGLGKTLAAGVGAVLLLTWATALAPALKFDALVYHLALPGAYLQSGRIEYIPGNRFWGMPQVGETLYTWAAALAGLEAAAGLGWLVGVLAIAGLVGLLAEQLGPRGAWVATAALLSGYSLAASLAWAYVDWWAILFGVGFLALAATYRQPPRDLGALTWAGIFAGLALGSKYSAGVLLLAGIGMVIWDWKKSGLRSLVGALLRLALPAILVSLPWWLKNALATGNPFYPFFTAAGAMDSFRLENYAIQVWGSWQDAVLLPWRASLTGVEGAAGYSASIGPLLLGLAPLAWLGRSRQQPGVASASVPEAAGWIALIGLLAWAVAGRTSGYLIQSRLYWCIFPALAALAGAGFRFLDRLAFPGLRLGRVAGALVLAVFAFAVLELGVGVVKSGAVRVLVAQESSTGYLEKNLGWYAPAAQALRGLPAGSRALMLWEPRGLYCAPVCQADELLDRWRSDLHGHALPAVLANWRAQGFTHLLVNRFGAEFIREQDLRYNLAEWQSLDQLLSSLAAPQDFGGAYQLYVLAP